MEVEQLSHTMYVFFLAAARLIAVFSVVPFLSRQALGTNMIRNGVAASFALLTYPIVEYNLGQESIGPWETFAIILKEALIGLLLGYLISIPFWTIESVGFFIDNQRGATMASSLNPLSGEQTSPLGILFSQALVTVFMISGAFLLLLYALYLSYKVWPIFSFFPVFTGGGPTFFISQLDALMRLTLLVGGPVVIAMFLSEFGLALISRFAPQLNVFILSLPIKSAVGIAFLCVYIGYVIHYFSDIVGDMDGILAPLFKLMS